MLNISPGPSIELKNQHTIEFVDVKDLWFAFRRRLGIFLLVSSLVFLVVLFSGMKTVPLYTSTTSVMMDFREKAPSDLTSAVSGLLPDAVVVDTEVEAIKSRVLAEKVVEKYNLVTDKEFNGLLREKSSFSKYVGELKSNIKSIFSKNDEVVASLPPELVEERVVSATLSRLGVRRKGLTYVIDISFKSEDPQKAAAISNAFANQYLTEQLDAKFDATSRVNGWLNDRLDELRRDLRNAENAVEIYRAETGLVSAEGTSLTEQQISDINAQLIIQRAELSESTARLNSVRSQISQGVGADNIAEVLNSTVIRDLRREQTLIGGRRAELSTRYGERHPEIAKVMQELSDIDRQLNNEIDRIVSNLQTENKIDRERVNSLESSLFGLKRELDTNNKSYVRLRELEREADGYKNLYNNFLEQFKLSDGQTDIIDADARVVSKGIVPTNPTSPKIKFVFLMASILGMLLGLIAIIAAELFDNGLATPKEVEQEVSVPFLTFIPQLGGGVLGFIKRIFRFHKKPEDYILEKPFSSFAESYRTVRTAIQLNEFDKKGKPLQLVAIVSPGPGDGKTTSALCLARLSAISGSKVIVIDCDTRRRGLTLSVNLESAKDFSDYLLSTDSDLDLYIEKDTKSGADILSLRGGKISLQDLFGTKRFLDTIEYLRKHYELIILDTPPILPVAQTRILANLADGVIISTRWRKTKIESVVLARKILIDARANVIGLIMTQAKIYQKYAMGNYAYNYKAYSSYYRN